MTRFNSFINKNTSDFWRDRFRPRDLLRVCSHIQSVLSSRLDMKLLESYDILNIPEHTVGNTRTWIPLILKNETFLGSDQDYKWQYTISRDVLSDENWLNIDAIYDKHVDPDHSYQKNIDYVQDGSLITFVNRVDLDNRLYISKGQYATYRIKHEIGTLLGYERKDSVYYRDSIEPVLVSFFDGPTYNNLLALLSVLFGVPVAKYDNEVVQSIRGNTVVTDKYTYQVENAKISVKQGDVLYKFQPLSDAVSLITHKTQPKWWEGRPIDLFQKYLVDMPITAESRNFIMENFLYDVILSVQVDLAKAGLDTFKENTDLLALMYDALPTRSDVLLGQSYSEISNDTDDGELTVPDDNNSGIRIHIKNMYGLDSKSGTFCIYAPELGRPHFQPDPEDTEFDYEKTPLLSLNDYKWHIYNKDDTDNFNEFWKDSPYTVPYVEPNYSKVFCRFSTVSPWLHKEDRIYDLTLGTTAALNKEDIQVTNGGYFSGLDIDLEEEGSLNDDISIDNIVSIESLIICDDTVMADWEYNPDDIEHSRDGLISKSDKKAEIYTDSIFVGLIPKNVTVYNVCTTPGRSDIEFYYSTDNENWIKATNSVLTTINFVSNNLYFKYIFYPTMLDRPELTAVRISIDAIAVNGSQSENTLTLRLSDIVDTETDCLVDNCTLNDNIKAIVRDNDGIIAKANTANAGFTGLKDLSNNIGLVNNVSLTGPIRIKLYSDTQLLRDETII